MRPIEDHASLGDLQTAARIGRNASIDWFSMVGLVNTAGRLGGPHMGASAGSEQQHLPGKS